MRVLVTGSTQGIGKALATAFVKNGDEVVVAAEGPAEEAAIAEMKKFFEENL